VSQRCLRDRWFTFSSEYLREYENKIEIVFTSKPGSLIHENKSPAAVPLNNSVAQDGLTSVRNMPQVGPGAGTRKLFSAGELYLYSTDIFKSPSRHPDLG
jgi:hypothetical protein